MFKLIRRIHPFTKKRKMEIIVQIFCNGKLDSKEIKIIMNEMRKLKYSLRKKRSRSRCSHRNLRSLQR